MFRIMLFLLTNLAIIVVAGIVLSVLGVGSTHGQGNTLNLQNLLVVCFVFGMTGSFISLLLSKWMAKRTTGTEKSVFSPVTSPTPLLPDGTRTPPWWPFPAACLTA